MAGIIKTKVTLEGGPKRGYYLTVKDRYTYQCLPVTYEELVLIYKAIKKKIKL